MRTWRSGTSSCNEDLPETEATPVRNGEALGRATTLAETLTELTASWPVPVTPEVVYLADYTLRSLEPADLPRPNAGPRTSALVPLCSGSGLG